MKPVAIPAALTVFAAAIVTVAFLPDGQVRAPVDLGQLALRPAAVDAETLLADALRANRSTAFEGTLTVVGVEGPSVFQMDVEAASDGTRTVDTGSWLFGQDRDGAWAASDEGQWLEQAPGAAPDIGVDSLLQKYRVTSAGLRELPTGDAWLLVVTERGEQTAREWLSVDVSTGLLVRRETFDDDGAAVRLVAFETLRTAGRIAGLAPPSIESTLRSQPETSEWNGIDVAELPGQYRLIGVTRHDKANMPAMTMVFSDGLYQLSVSPIAGELDGGHLQGAVLEHWGGLHLYRWPGAEPQRLVWSGDGHTFTAITDAPLDAVLPALESFPSDPAPGTMSRMRRGLERVVDTLWPFN